MQSPTAQNEPQGAVTLPETLAGNITGCGPACAPQVASMADMLPRRRRKRRDPARTIDEYRDAVARHLTGDAEYGTEELYESGAEVVRQYRDQMAHLRALIHRIEE